MPSLTFHGAAECVTGSCARLETGTAAVLVDCGLFQGPKTLKALNYQPFPFDPREIDAVLLTHAHLDHSGLLPKLVRAGFAGPIYATAPTRELARVLLTDAGEIQESEVRHLNHRNEQRGRPPVEPIYTARDIEPALERFRTVKLGQEIEVGPGLVARFWSAGHILGSASVEVAVGGADPFRVLFSGDLGPGGRDYMPDPEGPSGVDHLVMESTYGARERPRLDPVARRRMLADELVAAHAEGGPVLVPAFAVERAQELLVDLVQLMDDGAVPAGPIFLDSPLAIEATEVFVRRGWNGPAGRNPFEVLHGSDRIRFLEKPAQSDTLDRLRGWHVILAGSGMCDAGRVRKHLKRLLWQREATVLLTGFQAVGTLGRLLADGREHVRIQGEDVRVRARVRSLDVYSGHADAPGLVAWARARGPVSGRVFLLHGEPDAAAALKTRLVADGFAADAVTIPRLDARFELHAGAAAAAAAPAPRLAPGAAAALDWHNARAALLNALDEQLEAVGDDSARARLLHRLSETLAREARPDCAASTIPAADREMMPSSP